MRPLWNRLLPPCYGRGCCCDSVEAQELGLLVVGRPGTMDACDFLILLVSLILLLQLMLTVMASGGTAYLRYDYCGIPRPGAMKRRQLVLYLELSNNIFGEVYDTFHLQVLRHLHESQGCFCHRGDWSSEDWIRDIVEFVVKIAWGETSALSSSGLAFSFALIACPASCASSFILILRGVLGQIVFRNLMHGFVGVMLA